MGKYEKLGWTLANERSDKIRYSFDEIETILGFSLPQSAKLHRPWWANDSTHVQASDGWLNRGWKVDYVDMENQIVGFTNVDMVSQEQIRVYNKAEQTMPTTPMEFENEVRTVLSDYYKKKLYPGQVSEVPKLFDMISEDKNIVGDAKYLAMVHGESVPPAKFSNIAEHVWLLEKIDAISKFLVFGNDRRVPELWLKKYGKLVHDVDFFFYDIKNKQLEKMKRD